MALLDILCAYAPQSMQHLRALLLLAAHCCLNELNWCARWQRLLPLTARVAN